MSQWHLPAAHYLETWGDALTPSGSYVAIQPMIQPLFDGISEIELLSALLGQPKVIRVFIRSAGQTKLSGALVNASLDGLLPSGRPTMW